MTSMRTIICLVLWLIVSATTTLAETRIFDLKHRSAGGLALTVQDALGSEAKVVPVRYSLMVTAPAADVALAAELIARLDRPVRMLRVYVAQDQQESTSGSALGGGVAGRSGDTAVILGGRPETAARGGGGVVLRGDHGMITASGSAGSRTESYRAEQFLVTSEGSPARISVGRQLPVTERWLVLARRHLQVQESTRYESVDTGFEVTPELLGTDRVELMIHPFMALVDRQRNHEIRFSELATKVVIPVDSWFDLAGTMSSQDEVSREILGIAGREGGGSGSVRVRVELQSN